MFSNAKHFISNLSSTNGRCFLFFLIFLITILVIVFIDFLKLGLQAFKLRLKSKKNKPQDSNLLTDGKVWIRPYANSLADGRKRRFDAFLPFYNDRWRLISERQQYEWRVYFTLWTAIAALIALIMTRPELIQPIDTRRFWCIALTGLIPIFIHWLCWSFVFSRTRVDRMIAFEYQKEMHRLLDFEYPPRIEEELARIRRQQIGRWGNYISVANFSITVLLVAGLLVSLWFKPSQLPAPKSPALPSTNSPVASPGYSDLPL